MSPHQAIEHLALPTLGVFEHLVKLLDLGTPADELRQPPRGQRLQARIAAGLGAVPAAAGGSRDRVIEGLARRTERNSEAW